MLRPSACCVLLLGTLCTSTALGPCLAAPAPCSLPDSGTALQELRKHAKKVMQMLGHVIAMLHDLDKLVPQLKDLASRHIGYGVKLEEYEVGGFACHKLRHQKLQRWATAVKLCIAAEYGSGA